MFLLIFVVNIAIYLVNSILKVDVCYDDEFYVFFCISAKRLFKIIFCDLNSNYFSFYYSIYQPEKMYTYNNYKKKCVAILDCKYQYN